MLVLPQLHLKLIRWMDSVLIMARPKVSATKLAKHYAPITPIKYKHPDRRKSGEYLHNLLGYNYARQHSKVYRHENGGISEYWVIGRPDKIEDGRIIELKTGPGEKALKDVIPRADIQLQTYGYLTGLREGEIHLFDTETMEMQEPIPLELEPGYFEALMDGYLLKK